MPSTLSTKVLEDLSDEQLTQVQALVRAADKKRQRQIRKLMNVVKDVAGTIDLFPKRRKFRIYKRNLIAQVI